MKAYTFGLRLAVTPGTGALMLATPVPAFADTAGSSSPTASTPGQFSYTDPAFGDVQCNEVRHPGPVPQGLLNQDPALSQTAGRYDTVECRLATPDAARPGQTFLNGWNSDFGMQFDQNEGLIRIVENVDGPGYHGVATHPAG